MGSADIQGDLWGKAPRDWADFQERLAIPLWTAMLLSSGVGKDTRFLDVGCGGGGASVLAAKQGAHVVGLDAAEGMVEIARERVPEGDFRVGDIQFLPFEDDAFDVVFAANSIQYAEDSVDALRELGRVCKTTGRIVVSLFSSPDKVEYRAILKAVSGTLPQPPSGGGPFALSDPGILEGLMEQADLKFLSGGETNCPFEWPDFETFWRGHIAAGPVQRILRIVGEEKLKTALKGALESFRNVDGGFRIEQNMFRHIVATV